MGVVNMLAFVDDVLPNWIPFFFMKDDMLGVYLPENNKRLYQLLILLTRA